MNKLDKAIHTLKRIAGGADLSVDRLQQYAKDTLLEIAPRKPRTKPDETPLP